MKNYEVVIKKHKEITQEEINDLVALKRQYWKHDWESQLSWLKKNLLPEDIHIFVYDKRKLSAYLNLVTVQTKFDSEVSTMLGVGNVCVSQENRHTGMGLILMAQANALIRELKSDGILLCKSELIAFYERSGWEKVNIQEVFINDTPFYDEIMFLKYSKRKTELLERCLKLVFNRFF